MAELMLMTPMGLYGVLRSAESHVEAGDWGPAEQSSIDIGDEARRMFAADPPGNEDNWHAFLVAIDELGLTIKAHDVEGCHEAFADLRASLESIVGPETGAAVQ